MIQYFLEYLEKEKRYSHHTCTSYKRDLNIFSIFLLKTESLQDFRKVDKKIIRNFLANLSEKGFSKRSINRKVSSLKSFYKYLMKTGELQVSPMEGIRAPKFYSEKQVPFSEEEMQKVGKLLEETNYSILDQLIVETLYQTGIRKSELCTLKCQDIDFYRKEIKILGKGNKERIIPVSPSLISKFKEYKRIKVQSQDAEIYFFVSKKGKKLSGSYVYSVVNKSIGLVSLKKKKSPHMLRHSFATHILNNGGDISKLKKLMGHSSLAATEVYTQANIDDLKKTLAKSHPRLESL